MGDILYDIPIITIMGIVLGLIGFGFLLDWRQRGIAKKEK